MTTPNMSSITASLERSLQTWSLNNHHHNNNNSGGGGSTSIESGGGGGGSGGFQENEHDDISKSTSETTFELNSHISLPYHWEQCIDLKTGELYYINWRTGMKAKEDPRIAGWNGDFDEDDDDDDDSSYDSEDNSSSEESPPSFSRNQQCMNKINSNNNNNCNKQQSNENKGNNNVLVVGGCKVCMMYFMVPKQGEDCPKCNGQLLHFDKSDGNASSSP